MMRVLVLTDHREFAEYDSLFKLVRYLADDDRVSSVWVGSLFAEANRDLSEGAFFAQRIHSRFDFEVAGRMLTRGLEPLRAGDVDVGLLRIDPPVPWGPVESVLDRLTLRVVINEPEGIRATGRKNALVEFSDVAAGAMVCRSLDEIELAARRYGEIVLKPNDGAGGEGILRLGKAGGHIGNVPVTRQDLLDTLRHELGIGSTFLAMRFLSRVSEGDRRLVIVDSEVVACLDRIPASGSWLANLRQGGSIRRSSPEEGDLAIRDRISKRMSDSGVYFYGIDTLTGDEGERVLSEINSANVGGLVQAEVLSGGSPCRRAASGLVDVFSRKLNH